MLNIKKKFNLVYILVGRLFKLKSHFLFKDVHMKLHQSKKHISYLCFMRFWTKGFRKRERFVEFLSRCAACYIMFILGMKLKVKIVDDYF
jgi:hypothetical protein